MKKHQTKSRTPKRRKTTNAFKKSLRLLEMNGLEPTRENLRRGYKVFGVDLASGPDRTGLLIPPGLIGNPLTDFLFGQRFDTVIKK